MNFFKKALSLFIVTVIALSSVTSSAYAKEDKIKPSSIHYENVSLDEISKNELEEKSSEKMTFVENSKSDFVIKIGERCDDTVLRAVDVLVDTVYEMSGCRLKVSNEKTENRPCINIINSNNENTENDGYKIDITEKAINIVGNNLIGVRNGVYGFIEDYLGCMFLTAKDTFIPSHKSIYLEKCSKNHIPKMLWRDVYTYEVSFDGWADKLRLNGIDSRENPPVDNIEKNHHYDWGTWCHNCYGFLSPEKYFDSHPEYFSEYKGERITEYNGREAYLCLSNPQVLEIVKAEMKRQMDENPDKKYWDFSGSDNPSLRGCQCDECASLDKAAGGTGMGSLMPFLNELAKEFPNKYISTLAYLHTVEAPENIEIEDNIVIKLCSMPGDQAYSYLNGGTKTADDFQNQVKDWAKVCDKIIVWDYVVNFSNLLLPFPNFAVQVENQKFYEENNVMGVFHQGSREKGGELAELRSYVLSRLLWEGSTMDVGACVSKYVTAYFGAAAPKVIEYMNLLSDSLYDSQNTLGLYDSPEYHRGDYLSYENLLKYKTIVEEAKASVKDSPIYAERLEKIEIPVLYGLMSHPKIDKNERELYKEKFIDLCKKYDITKVREWQTLDDFMKNDYEKGISNEKLNMWKPYIIAAAVIVGVAIIAFVLPKIVRLIKKKKKR